MKISVEFYDKKYSIESDSNEYNTEEIRDEFFIPLLLAMGFHPDSVNELFFDKEEDDA